jgi:hypothetical protein
MVSRRPRTWAAFYGSDADAVVAGDVAMRAEDLMPVLKALRSNGIEVVAIHHHMTGTGPTLYFLHYWGRGAAPKLAAAFRAAVDQTGRAASATRRRRRRGRPSRNRKSRSPHRRDRTARVRARARRPIDGCSWSTSCRPDPRTFAFGHGAACSNWAPSRSNKRCTRFRILPPRAKTSSG